MSEFINDLILQLRDFSKKRDWQQFHSPKNLAMALIVEAAELVEHFQWISQEQSTHPDEKKREAIGEEMADVFIYLVCLADRLGIDLIKAVEHKMALNKKKYPAGQSRGVAGKL